MFYIVTAVRRRGNSVLPALRPDTLTLSAVDQSSSTAIEHVEVFGPVIARCPARSRPRPDEARTNGGLRRRGESHVGPDLVDVDETARDGKHRPNRDADGDDRKQRDESGDERL